MLKNVSPLFPLNINTITVVEGHDQVAKIKIETKEISCYLIRRAINLILVILLLLFLYLCSIKL